MDGAPRNAPSRLTVLSVPGAIRSGAKTSACHGRGKHMQHSTDLRATGRDRLLLLIGSDDDSADFSTPVQQRDIRDEGEAERRRRFDQKLDIAKTADVNCCILPEVAP
jgi:hypothetical protein